MSVISVIIPTRNRLNRLVKTLSGLFRQNCLIDEVIVIDASDNYDQVALCIKSFNLKYPGRVVLIKAGIRGAAVQRNSGMSLACGKYVLFLDDDIDFIGDSCIGDLIYFLEHNPDYSGVSVVIKNQFPAKIGRITRFILSLIDGELFSKKNYGGTLIGPALNFLPTMDLLKDTVLEVQWLNTTCTLYRNEHLPVPVFDSVFTGYSLMEDVTLSIRVAKKGRLAILRDALIFHDTQPGDHKSNLCKLAKMGLVNRDYVARKIMNRDGVSYWWGLIIWECFQVCATLASRSQRQSIFSVLKGKTSAFWQILRA